MYSLNEIERKNALMKIIPKELALINPNSENLLLKKIIQISKNDFSVGMLKSKDHCLIESIPMFDESNEIINKNLLVDICDIDKIIMSISLKAFLKSKEDKHAGDFGLILPPMSYSYPLMLAYHLILHHLCNNLTENISDEEKFANNSGILIVTDNFEMLSRIYRTSVSGAFFRDFINTYTLQAGKFKKFTSHELVRAQNRKDDGSLPWLCLFRAARYSLPEKLERRPEIILVDLLPFRHRRRAQSIISWAKSNSNHTIVLAPLHGLGTYNDVKGCVDNVITLDKYTLKYLTDHFKIERRDRSLEKVTNAWSLSCILPYLEFENPEMNVYKIVGLGELNEKITDFFKIIPRTFNRDGTQSKAFRRLINIFYEMLGLPIQLGWYESARLLTANNKLYDLINSCLRIPGGTFEEQQIQNDLLYHAVKSIEEIYNMLLFSDTSPRGEVLCSLIEAYRNQKILIITASKIADKEVKVWVRSKTGLPAKELSNIDVVSQQDWAKSQLNKIYNDNEKTPSIFILTNPWQEKYLSSFYVPRGSKIFSICLSYEMNHIVRQFSIVHRKNEEYFCDFYYSLGKLFDYEYERNLNTDIYKLPLKVKVHDIQIGTLQNDAENFKEFDSKVDTLFDQNAFLSMFDSEQEDINNLTSMGMNEYNIDPDNYSDDDISQCVKVSGRVGINEENMNFLFSYDNTIKIIRHKMSNVVNIRPIELHQGDCLIILKQNEKQEIFETILELASNTMAMQWIKMNVQEWREMTKILWSKYYNEALPKKYTFERILNDVVKYGGNIESTYSVKNWIYGDVSSVKYEQNVMAVAKILGDKYYINRVKTIHKAMKQLWNIHIRLGRKLVAITSQYASMKNFDLCTLPEWVDLGMDIRIPVQDILNSIDLIEVDHIDTERDYFTYSKLLQIPIPEDKFNLFIERGLIKYE